MDVAGLPQVSPALAVLVLAAVIFLIIWLVAIRPGSSSDTTTSAATQPAVTASSGTQRVVPAPGRVIHRSGARKGVPLPAGANGRIISALGAHRVVALLVTNPGGADDEAVRGELEGLRFPPSKVLKVIVSTSQLASLPVITASVSVNQTPTFVIIDRTRTVTTIVGFADRFELSTRIQQALNSGVSNAPLPTTAHPSALRGSSAPVPAAVRREGPYRLLVQAATALRHERKVSLTMNGSSSHFRVAGRLDITGSAVSLDAVYGRGPQNFELIYIPGQAYMRANYQFWSARTDPSRANLLAARWVQFPPSAVAGLSRSLQGEGTKPARCYSENNGTLSLGGTATVGGRPAIIIRDAGDRPGSAPGFMEVSRDWPHVPLAVSVTGPPRPGGRSDPACGSGGDFTGTMTFAYGNPAPIAPPADAIHPNSPPSL